MVRPLRMPPAVLSRHPRCARAQGRPDLPIRRAGRLRSAFTPRSSCSEVERSADDVWNRNLVILEKRAGGWQTPGGTEERANRSDAATAPGHCGAKPQARIRQARATRADGRRPHSGDQHIALPGGRQRHDHRAGRHHHRQRPDDQPGPVDLHQCRPSGTGLVRQCRSAGQFRLAVRRRLGPDPTLLGDRLDHRRKLQSEHAGPVHLGQ